MNTFHSCPIEQFDPIIDRIGKDWMLISATDGKAENTMTASWGCCGFLWNRPIAVCFVRPQRFTCPIMESSDHFSLAFFDETHRDALRYCGSHSGRNGDKFSAAGLTVSHSAQGVPYPAEATCVLICKKLYVQTMEEDCFVEPSLLSNYAAGDFHRVFIGEITEVLCKK